jgi:hypothetical protein
MVSTKQWFPTGFTDYISWHKLFPSEKSTAFWVLAPCNSQTFRRRASIFRLKSPPASTGFLLGLLLNPKDGGDMLFRNVKLQGVTRRQSPPWRTRVPFLPSCIHGKSSFSTVQHLKRDSSKNAANLMRLEAARFSETLVPAYTISYTAAYRRRESSIRDELERKFHNHGPANKPFRHMHNYKNRWVPYGYLYMYFNYECIFLYLV